MGGAGGVAKHLVPNQWPPSHVAEARVEEGVTHHAAVIIGTTLSADIIFRGLAVCWYYGTWSVKRFSGEHFGSTAAKLGFCVEPELLAAKTACSAQDSS